MNENYLPIPLLPYPLPTTLYLHLHPLTQPLQQKSQKTMHITIHTSESKHFALLIQTPLVLLVPLYVRRRLIRPSLHLLEPTHFLYPPLLIQRALYESPWILLIRLNYTIATCAAAIVRRAFDLDVGEGGEVAADRVGDGAEGMLEGRGKGGMCGCRWGAI
jgi:hypothetical protein